MHIVLFDTRVGAAHHASHAADAAIDDVLVKRRVGGPKGTAQHVVDVLMGKSMYADALLFGDLDGELAVFEAADGLDDNLIGTGHGVVLIEFDVGSLLQVASRIGGDQRGVVALGYIHQRLLDALDVYGHGIYGTGDEYRFGGGKVTRMGYAVA